MAVKFKLSDDEKKKANKLLNAMQEDKEKGNKSNDSLNTKTQTSQEVSLPRASENSKVNRFDRKVENRLSMLPTVSWSNEDPRNIKEIENKFNLNNLLPTANGKYFKTGEFEDGYQFGDISKTWLGTMTDATQDLAKGILKPAENVLDIGANLVASGIASGTGAIPFMNKDEVAKSIRDFADKDLLENITSRVVNATPFGIAYNIAKGTPEKIFNPAEIEWDSNKNVFENVGAGFQKAYLTGNNEKFEKSSVLGEKADNAVEMVGYSFGNMMFGDLLPGKTGNIGLKIGTHTLNLPTLSIAGGMAGGLQEANSKENVSEAERWAKGISGGLIEGLSEGMFEALGVGGNDITDAWKKNISNKFSSRAGKMLAKLGVEQTGEALEEFVSYAGNWLIDNGIINQIGNADFSSKWNWDEVIEEMVMAYVTTGISSGGNIILENNSSIKAVEQELGRKLTQKEKAGVTQAVIDGTLYEKYLQQNDTQGQQNQNTEQLPVANETNKVNNKEIATEEINNSNISEADKQAMLDTLNSMQEEVTEADLSAIKQTISALSSQSEQNNELPTNQNYKNDTQLRQKYMQYKNDTSSYDSTAVDEVLDMMPVNRNGNRTARQWLKIADEIGNRISEKSDAEIERIAYRSWFDIEPSKNITRYDNQSKQTVGFQKLTSDEWVNTINNAVNNARQNSQVMNSNIDLQNNEQLAVANEINRRNGVTENDNLITSAEKHSLNFNDVSIQSIQQVMDKAGIKSRFDIVDQFIKKDGTINKNIGSYWSLTKNQDGTYTREIIFNPQASEKTIIQEMAVHELFHDVFAKNTRVSTDLYDNVKSYLEQDEEYNKQKENLKNQYKDVYGEEVDQFITEEAIAKTLQTKFGTQEEINRLVNYNPSKARLIYDWIVDKLNKITGNKIERLYWEDVRNKFERAYSQEGNYQSKQNKIKYDMREDNKLGKYWNVENSKDIFRGIKNKLDLQDKAYNYILDGNNNFETITDVIDGKQVKFRRVSAREYTYGRNNKKLQGNQYIEKMRMAPSIDDLMENASITYHSPLTHENKLFPNGFNNYQGKVGIDNDIFQYIVRVGKSKNSDSVFYDLSLEFLGEKNKVDNKVLGGKTSSLKSTLFDNSIPSSDTEVNTTTKYSIQESENNSELSEEAKKQLHRYVGLDNETLNKKISDVIENKQNMYEEAERIRKEYKEFQNTEEFKNALEDFAHSDNVSQQVEDMMNKAQKFADKIRYYDNAYKEYQAQYEAINSILNGNEKDIRSVQDIVKEAEKHFGVTNNFKETAYIDINGKQIDFSGKHEGGPSGERTLDHRQINEIDTDMNTFIDMGNIRILPEGGGINLKIEPNSKQYSKLREYIDSVDGEIYIDIDKANNTYDSAEYKAGTSSSKIISDLQYYFKNGKFPAKSSLADFRYSIEKKSFDKYITDRIGKEGTRTSLKDLQLPKAQNQTTQAKTDTFMQSNNENSWSKQQENNEEQEKIAEILEKPVEKVKEKNRAWAIAKANLIDKGIVFEELSHKTKNRELQGKWDYTLSASARGQNAIGQARFEMDPKTKTQKQISKSLEDIRAEVGSKANDFQKYMYHQLNIDRMTLEDRFGTKNKPVFGKNVTAEISQRIVNQYEGEYPEFKEWAQDVYDFNNANKQELVKNGVISQELADKLYELYPHYVPIKRIDAKGNAIKVPLDTNRTGVNSPLAKAKGGNSDIQPLFQTIADRTMQTYRASARNNFGVELMNTLNSVQQIQQTDIDTILEEIGDNEGSNELLKEGKNGNLPTFTVFNNGEKTTFEITKDMYDALKPQAEWINQLSNNKVAKTLNKVSNFRRGVLTEYNPVFSITNALKDAQDVIINSQHPAKTYAKFGEAYAQIISKGYWYNEYLQNGGEQNSYFKDGEFTSDKKQSKLKTALHVPLDVISNVNNVIEMAPRLAEYIASRESGTSIETSMLDASRVTTNFKAGGDLTKTLNRNGATFLNASVQGFQQQIRNIQEANAKGLKGYAVLACKYAVAGLPAVILNGLVWKDDKDYEDLQDYVKDNYYIIGKYGEGQFIRIPKGRVAATIQKIIGNATQYLTDDKKELNIDNVAKDFWEDLSFTADNVAPNNPLNNNVISPIIDVITNISWYGEDIVPTRLQDKPKTEQYDETTDSLSIWLGEKLNQSPYKINYLLDQYGGGIADLALPKMTKQVENGMLEDKFTTDSVIKSRYPGEFYSKIDELKVNSNASNATDEDILKYKWFSGISKTMSDLYKEKREIQNSDISDKEKRQQIKDVQAKINKLAKGALNEVEDITISGNVADVNGTQYYKYKGEWTKLSEEDNKKTQNISLKTFADYKQKVYNKTESQKNTGKLSENQSLKDKEKINILLDSNYSNKEKAELYEKYIGINDSKYEILKNTNINITEYLKYKTQEFESDKKDNGTVNGKTVSGSKKTKVYDYVDNMNITYTQKLLLLGMDYTLSNNEQSTLANYINSMNINKDKKMEIYGKLKGFTVYKNGTVNW